MTGAALLLLVLALAVAVVDWIAVHAGNRPLEYVCKPLVVVVLIAAALAVDAGDRTVVVLFVVALVASLVGDVALMLPHERFLAGLAAFFVAHVAYVVGMHVEGMDGPRFLVGVAVVTVVAVLVGARIVRGVRAGPDPGLAGPVVAYTFVISAMLASAMGLGEGAAVAGALAFYASDAVLAWNRFVAPVANGPLVIIVTYHLAQLGLVASLAP